MHRMQSRAALLLQGQDSLENFALVIYNAYETNCKQTS
jgi:hypothetical protein